MTVLKHIARGFEAPVAIDATFQSNVLDEAAIRGFAIPTSKIPYLNQQMINMKASGFFAKQDFFYNFPTGDPMYADFTRLDWKRKGVVASVYGGMTYNGERWNSDGSTGYFDPEFNPATQGVNYTLNNASIGALITQESGSFVSAYVCGQPLFNTDQLTIFRNKTTTTGTGFNVNANALASNFDGTDDGYVNANRISSSQIQLNWVAKAAQLETSSSVSIRSGKLLLFRRFNTYTNSAYRVRLFHAGASISNAETQTFRTNYNNFLTAMGMTPMA